MISSLVNTNKLSFIKLLLFSFFVLITGSVTGILSESSALLLFFSYTILSGVLFPASSLNILLFCVPFVLGASKNEFFIFYDLLAIMVILIYMFNYWKNKRIKEVFLINDSISILALLFLVSSCISLPLDLRYFSYFIRTQPLENIFNDFLLACEETPMFWVRTLFNRVTGFIIFFIARDTFSEKSRLTEYIRISGWQAFIIIPFALLIFKNIVPHILYNFTTIQFVGALGIVEGVSAMSGLAYNPGYWGQYLAIISAIIIIWGLKSGVKERAAASLTLVLLVISIPLTRQRGPMLALFMTTFFSVFSYLFFKLKKVVKVLLSAIGVSALLLLLLVVIDTLFFKGFCSQRIFSRSFSSSYRGHIWQVAIEMYKNYKLSGIGIGKFHYLFPMFCQKTSIPWEGTILYVRSTAHNLYFHVLAEQGIVGLSIFILFAFSIIKSVFNIEQNKENLYAVFFSAALVSFLSFCFTQHMFYLRGIEILFWSYSGLISSFSLNQHKIQINLKKILLALLLIGTIFLLRIKDILEFQLP